jgi:hypothetical protein
MLYMELLYDAGQICLVCCVAGNIDVMQNATPAMN